MPDDPERLRRFLAQWLRQGAIFIPPTTPTRHGEMENIKAYVKYSEIVGRVPTITDFVARLREVGLQSLMVSLSRLMTILHVDGVTTAGLQPLLRNSALSPAMLERLQRLPGLPPWDERIVFFPQQVLFTMKMAVLHSPDLEDRRSDDDFRDPLIELLLMAADIFGRHEFPADRDEAEAPIVAYLVRDYLHNMREQLRYLVPRASLLYLRLPLDPDLRGDPDFIDLPAVFRAATGFDLRDYLSFGFVMAGWWARQSYLQNTYDESHVAVNPRTFFENATIDRAYAAQILRSFTQTHDEAKTAISGRPGDPASRTYDFRPFMERPLYEVRDGVIVPLHLGYLEARFTNGIFWTISDHLDGADREKFRRFFGKILETYVNQVFERAVPDAHGLVRRRFRDFSYQTPQGERRTSDVILLYPKTAIFLEATAARIRFEATAVSDDVLAFDTDIDHIILANARQLTARIRDFRAGLYPLGGVSVNEIVRIFPVIVTFHAMPEATPIWGRIRKQLAAHGLLSDPGVEALQLIDIEEIEILEALLAQGTTLLEILEARANDAERRNIGLKNFVIARYPREGNEFLRHELEDIGGHATRLFFGEDRTSGGP